MNKVTVPGLSTDIVDTEHMIKLTKTTDRSETTVYAARYCSEAAIINGCGRFFFNHGSGSRPSYSYHKSGVITGNTDHHAGGAPIRRRAVYILCWSKSDQSWDMWSCGSVSSVEQGKRYIDRILESGVLSD